SLSRSSGSMSELAATPPFGIGSVYANATTSSAIAAFSSSTEERASQNPNDTSASPLATASTALLLPSTGIWLRSSTLMPSSSIATTGYWYPAGEVELCNATGVSDVIFDRFSRPAGPSPIAVDSGSIPLQ